LHCCSEVFGGGVLGFIADESTQILPVAELDDDE
jgi:hypothetical protein